MLIKLLKCLFVQSWLFALLTNGLKMRWLKQCPLSIMEINRRWLKDSYSWKEESGLAWNLRTWGITVQWAPQVFLFPSHAPGTRCWSFQPPRTANRNFFKRQRKPALSQQRTRRGKPQKRESGETRCSLHDRGTGRQSNLPVTVVPSECCWWPGSPAGATSTEPCVYLPSTEGIKRPRPSSFCPPSPTLQLQRMGQQHQLALAMAPTGDTNRHWAAAPAVVEERS